MQCRGNFVFKTLTHRNAGTFTNDKGEELKYSEAYILKVDEESETGDINERKFKIAPDKLVLVNTLKDVKAYQTIELIFNVVIYTSRVSIEVADVNVIDEQDF